MNVSSVKNLNGEVFSAIQDASLTDTVQTNSSNWQDITAYQNASANYLTAHQAISAEEWNDCYDNVNTNSGAWGGTPLPITGRDGIDLEVDNGTLYIGASALTGSIDYIETNSANIDEVVTNYQNASGTYLTAHQSLEGYAVESAFEYNGDDLITAYNGSAFAQYGAEKQWLVHDDTLVHASNSAQYALGVNVSALQQLMGIDKTVLWQGRITAVDTTAQLSEPLTNFDKLEFVLELDNLGNRVDTFLASGQQYSYSYSYPFGGSFRHDMAWLHFNEDYKTWQFVSANHRAWNTDVSITENQNNWQWTFYTLKQINGIGRKQV